MKVLTFIIILCVCCLNANAQKYWVMGQIVDDFTYDPIDSVTVRFLRTDSTEVERFVSKDETKSNNRSFGESISAPGKYILHFSKRGYEDTYKTVNFRYQKYRITGGTFGRVLMKKKLSLTERRLDEVVVTATRIKMVMKGDTIQYNADAFQLREGSMLDQLIAMLPGAELREGGVIYVNGKRISNLLVNGEDFFRGNPRVALENLPSYMVDKIKVYDLKPDLNKMMDKNINVHKGMWTNESQITVMDVNLKRKYSIGWIANASVGSGTGKHYAAKAFALRFTPHSRLAFMGYSNNVYGNSYYDANGNWQNPGGSDNQTTHELSSDLLVNDKNKKYKIKNLASFKWKESENDEYQHTTNYLGTKNIDGISRSHQESRDWHIRDIAEFDYKMDENEKSYTINLKPEIWYNNYRNAQHSRRAEWDKRITERYMGEALDSLFMEGSSEIYRENLISSLRQTQQNDGHLFYTKANLQTTWDLNGNGNLRVGGLGYYSMSANRNLIESAAYDFTSMQDRYSDHYVQSYDYSGNVGYDISYYFGNLTFNVSPNYSFRQQFQSSNRDYYRLENTEYAEMDFDCLASMKDALTQYIDITNSAYSDEWKRTHKPELGMYMYWWDDKHHRAHTVNLSIPMRIEQKKYDYKRGSIDTLFHRNYYFFEPNVRYRIDHNSNRNGYALERHTTLSYSMSHSSPYSEYLTDYRDDATPLVVRTGNPNLKASAHHKAELAVENRYFTKRVRTLNWNLEYDQWSNLVSQSMMYDMEAGIRTYRPENISGNWALATQVYYASTLDKRNRWNYHLTTNFNYRHSEDYASLVQDTSSEKVGTDHLLTKLKFNVNFSRNYYSLSGELNGEWIHAISDRFTNQNVFNINYRVSGGMPLPWKLQLSTSLLLNTRYGYDDDRFNTSQLIWSARLKRVFLNGRLGAEVEAFDLLNQMSNRSYSLNAQMQTESYRNVLRRYVMFNISFRLNKEPKK